jgi:hypothetical protein
MGAPQRLSFGDAGFAAAGGKLHNAKIWVLALARLRRCTHHRVPVRDARCRPLGGR